MAAPIACSSATREHSDTGEGTGGDSEGWGTLGCGGGRGDTKGHGMYLWGGQGLCCAWGG